MISFRSLLLSLPLLICCSGTESQSPDGGMSPIDSGTPVDASIPDPDASLPDPDAMQAPLQSYGESCELGNECLGGVCVGLPNGVCSRRCDSLLAHDCRAESAFCLQFTAEDYYCHKSIDVGIDTDEAILLVNDTVSRLLHNLDDVDMFPIHINITGPVVIQVTPGNPSLDVQLDVYNSLGEPAAIANDLGNGGVEALNFPSATVGNKVYAVVRNIGNSTGDYSISVRAVD